MSAPSSSAPSSSAPPSTARGEERMMTSAINNMTVADVRKALSCMRKEWQRHSVMRPFYPSYRVAGDMTVQEFAFKFVMGHHAKRHAKFSVQKAEGDAT